jgi:hypothetical protein
MAHVLLVPALEFGDPVTVLVGVKTGYGALHHHCPPSGSR